jgi:hypothetical protein
MVDFVAGLAAVSQSLKIVKDLSQINQEFDKAELKLRIAEISGALATANLTIAQSQTEMSEKDAEIAKLRAAFKEKQDLVELRGFFYRKNSEGKPQGDPYCPRCIQDGRLHMMGTVLRMGRPVHCPNCESNYQNVSTFPFED